MENIQQQQKLISIGISAASVATSILFIHLFIYLCMYLLTRVYLLINFEVIYTSFVGVRLKSVVLCRE